MRKCKCIERVVYVGYMMMVCSVFGLITGSLGFLACPEILKRERENARERERARERNSV